MGLSEGHFSTSRLYLSVYIRLHACIHPKVGRPFAAAVGIRFQPWWVRFSSCCGGSIELEAAQNDDAIATE